MMGRASLADTIPPPAFQFDEDPGPAFEAASPHNASHQDHDSGRGSGSREGNGGGGRGGVAAGGGPRGAGGGGGVELRASGGPTWKGEGGAGQGQGHGQGRVNLGYDGAEEQNVASRSRSRVGGLEGGGGSVGMGGPDSPLRRPVRAAGN